jgi:uncharacterized membrane protein YeaQ/YmgE (transglycosylase-associated protein family)
MIMFAMVFDPAAIAGWLCAGLAVGWLSGKMMQEPSYGAVGDLIVGAIGGLAGGLIYGLVVGNAGFWDGALVAFISACVLIGVVRAATALRSE